MTDSNERSTPQLNQSNIRTSGLLETNDFENYSKSSAKFGPGSELNSMMQSNMDKFDSKQFGPPLKKGVDIEQSLEFDE